MNVTYMGNDDDTTSAAVEAAKIEAKAGVWSTLIEGLSNVGMTIAAATGMSKEPVVVQPTGAAPVVTMVPSTAPAAFDPTMLAVVGIPAALVAVALIARPRRRK